MSIRTKIALVLGGAVILPLAASTIFWTLMFQKMVDPEIGLSTLVRGRQQRELALAKAFAEPTAKRSATATERLTTTAQQLDRDLAELGGQLGRLGCTGPAPSAACDDAARAFLARHEGNLDGVRLRLGDAARDVVRADVPAERAAASAAAFAPLE